jgi:23S rRNA (cytosine1962-C5)-methyltransferase
LSVSGTGRGNRRRRKPVRAAKLRPDAPTSHEPRDDVPAETSDGNVDDWPRLELKTARTGDHVHVYRKMCRPTKLPPGTWVRVVDRDGAEAGFGIYNPMSQIGLRMVSEDPARPPDDDWLAAALATAVTRRRRLGIPDQTDAWRAVNAEGDGLSGLIVDVFGPHAVVELFSAGWYRRLKALLPAVRRAVFGPDAPADRHQVFVRADADTEKAEGFRVRDFAAAQLPDDAMRVIVREGRSRFHVDLRRGHKTGYFCDQRDNRARVAALARDRRMLDVCCYTGGFGIRALVEGEARHVTAIDLDESAVDLTRTNADLNRVADRLDARHADAFPAMRELAAAGERFDLIVLDPPKFARGKREIDAGLTRYRDLNRFALPLLARDGLLVTCSCSGAISEGAFHTAIRRASNDAGIPLTFLDTHGAAPDHPVAASFPEGRYLKVAIATPCIP